jgi:hypothetical protein
MNLPKQETRPATSYRRIKLTQGQFAIVDTSDYDWLMQWKWYANWNPETRSFYALRHSRMVNYVLQGPLISMQRFILGLKPGDKRKADHIRAGHTLDNRRSNLRIADNQQSSWNRRRYRNNKSGFKGVVRTKDGRFRATITKAGEEFYLGRFKTPEEAYAAYCSAAMRLHGEFAHLG